MKKFIFDKLMISSRPCPQFPKREGKRAGTRQHRGAAKYYFMLSLLYTRIFGVMKYQ